MPCAHKPSRLERALISSGRAVSWFPASTSLLSCCSLLMSAGSSVRQLPAPRGHGGGISGASASPAWPWARQRGVACRLPAPGGLRRGWSAATPAYRTRLKPRQTTEPVGSCCGSCRAARMRALLTADWAPTCQGELPQPRQLKQARRQHRQAAVAGVQLVGAASNGELDFHLTLREHSGGAEVGRRAAGGMRGAAPGAADGTPCAARGGGCGGTVPHASASRVTAEDYKSCLC